MNMFKVSQVVVAKEGQYIHFVKDSLYNLPRGPLVVEESGSGYIYVSYFINGYKQLSPALNPDSFTLLEESMIVIKRPDYIDWDQVHPNYNYMARDEDGVAYLYSDEPKCKETLLWWSANDDFKPTADARGFKSYVRGNVSWDNSLVKRPT